MVTMRDDQSAVSVPGRTVVPSSTVTSIGGARVKPASAQGQSAYERISHDNSTDSACMRDVLLGKRIGFYLLRGQIGSGNFSQVKLGIHALTKEKVAVKILDKTKLDSKTRRLLSREIATMECLHHPNVIRLYEVVETFSKLYIVLEYAGEGELFTRVKVQGRFSEPDAKTFFAQIVAAVQHLHDNDVIHRDLKAENIFFATSRLVKVGDFGFSVNGCSNDQMLSTLCGSPPYAAPELFREGTYQGRCVDVWALGILLFFMVTGTLPFRADTVGKLKRLIIEGTYHMPEYVPDQCQFMIRNILRPVPSDRYTLAEIRDSSWLSGEAFPEALDPRYKYCRQLDPADLREDELEARKRLEEFGISEKHLAAVDYGKQSRSSVSGTYHIVLHRIQKAISLTSDDSVQPGGPSGGADAVRGGLGRQNTAPAGAGTMHVDAHDKLQLAATTERLKEALGLPVKVSRVCTIL